MAIKLADANGSDAAHLLHELQVHHQELEMQNRELRRTQLELAAARDRYRDLYDRAPVAYLTLDPRGRILEANLTAAQLLAQPQSRLAGRPLAAFMAPGDADRWHLLSKEAFKHAGAWCAEFAFQRLGGAAFVGQLDGLLVAGADEPHSLRVTLTDTTPRRHASADRRAALQVMAEQEAQRHRVARELHDDLGQRLSALKMQLAAKEATALRDDDVAAMLATLDDAVATVRRMATELRPLMLDDLGLSAAVEALARRAARQHGLQLKLRLTAPDPAPGDRASVTLYRLLQASLAQLTGTPGLDSLAVELHEADGQRTLTVLGRRARPWPEAGPPMALERWTALRETAHLMGCTLELADMRRGGQRVTVRMPLEPDRTAPPPP